jgi:transposase
MTRRTFTVIDVVEILLHWHAGRPKAEVARALEVDRSTVRKYTAKAEAEGFVPTVGGPYSRDEWAAHVREWFPELIDPRARSLTHALIEPYRETVIEMLKASTATTVHQRLRDEQGLTVGLTSFRRWLWREFPEEASRSAATPWRPEVEPGEEAQIDYGYLGRWFDQGQQRWRRVWAFVMVLAYSRHMFVRPVLTMDQRAWTACHVEAFSFFDAVPSRLVCDNLKTGVLKPDIYDPRLNRSYAELASHYGCLIDPARAAKPKDKPRVERQMPYVRDSFWSGRDWTGVADMAEGALRWCAEVAGPRSHRSLEGATPVSVFTSSEKATMLTLPPAPFELASWTKRVVPPDCYVKATGKAIYTVPWRFIGRTLDARESDRRVEFYSDGELVKTWARVERGRQTDWSDFPPEKVAFFMATPQWCLRRAAELGVSVKSLVEGLLATNALYRLRQAQGVVRLADKHGAERLDAACRRAIDVGDPSYKTVKGILAAGTEHDGEEESPQPLAAAHLHGQEAMFGPEAEAAGQ